MQIKCDTKEVNRKLKALKGQSDTALKKVVSDFKRRAPAWIAKDITAVYNIKKKEARGAMTASGSGLDAEIDLKGRVLTVAHFGLKPKNVPAKRPYTVSAEIFKGKRESFHTLTTFIHNGTAFSREKNGTISGRLPMHALYTLSIPQMAGNEEVTESIQKDIDENLMKRAQHYLERYLGS